MKITKFIKTDQFLNSTVGSDALEPTGFPPLEIPCTVTRYSKSRPAELGTWPGSPAEPSELEFEAPSAKDLLIVYVTKCLTKKKLPSQLMREGDFQEIRNIMSFFDNNDTRILRDLEAYLLSKDLHEFVLEEYTSYQSSAKEAAEEERADDLQQEKREEK